MVELSAIQGSDSTQYITVAADGVLIDFTDDNVTEARLQIRIGPAVSNSLLIEITDTPDTNGGLTLTAAGVIEINLTAAGSDAIAAALVSAGQINRTGKQDLMYEIKIYRTDTAPDPDLNTVESLGIGKMFFTYEVTDTEEGE